MPRRIITTIAALACLSLAPMGAAAATAPRIPAPVAGTASGPTGDGSSVTGTLHVAVGDDFKNGASDTIAVVQTTAGPVTVPAALVEDIEPGTQVTVTTSTGGEVDAVEPAADEAADSGATPDGTAAGLSNAGLGSAALGSAGLGGSAAAGVGPTPGITDSGQHYLTYVPIVWSGQAATSATTLTNVTAKLDRYYDVVSNHRIRVATRKVTAPVTLSSAPTSANSCSADAIDKAAAATYKAVAPANRFEHVVLVVPPIAGCPMSGYGSLRAWNDGRNHIWLFGADGLVNATVAHEFGHNLGLQHSDEIKNGCQISAPKAAIPPSCINEYGDPWDIMGNSLYVPRQMVTPYSPTAEGFMSAANLDRIGLLSSAEKTTVAATSTTVTLKPVAGGSGLRLVTIPWGPRTYTLEYRAALGLDSWINTPNGLTQYGVPIPSAGSGVVVRLRDNTAGAHDETPFFQRSTGHAALPVGTTNITSDGALRVKVNSVTGTAASVTITRTADRTAPVIVTSQPTTRYKTYDNGRFVIATKTLSMAWGVGDADSAIATVALQVDGKTRATYTRPAAYAPFKVAGLKYGRHTWRLVTKDLFGNAKAQPTRVFYVDSGAKPKVKSKPRAYLTAGTVSTKSVPTRVAWAAKDECGITRTWFGSNRGLSKVYNGAPKSIGVRLGISRSTQFGAQAMDCWGSTTAVAKSKSTTAGLDKQSKRKGYHGTWKATKYKKALGGTEQVTKKKRAYVSYKVKARSIGWVATKGKDRGKAAVYVDGKKVAVINLYAKKTTYAQQVFTKTFSKSGKHTIKIVNLTSKKIGIDGFTRLS